LDQYSWFINLWFRRQVPAVGGPAQKNEWNIIVVLDELYHPYLLGTHSLCARPYSDGSLVRKEVAPAAFDSNESSVAEKFHHRPYCWYVRVH
jgi:hypothetical protein